MKIGMSMRECIGIGNVCKLVWGGEGIGTDIWENKKIRLEME